jgi:hypothetical protein
MTSLRKRKKTAAARGLSVPQLELLGLVEEMLEAHRWLQVLGYANQFILAQKVEVTDAERDAILEAATRAVDKDARLERWRARLGRLKSEMLAVERELRSERRTGEAEAAESSDG